MAENNNCSAGGYIFFTEKDAQLAKAEQQRVEYLEERIDYTRPESILYVYEKIIKERVFKTPVGLEYLKKLQQFLLAQDSIPKERIKDIPLYVSFGGELREETSPARKRVQPSGKKSEEQEKAARKQLLYHSSLILNILLVIALCAMFTISLKSDNPNILNYKKNLTNQYASWEQQLTERENAVREKEKELQFTE